MADKLEDITKKTSNLIEDAGTRLDSDIKALREDIGKLAGSVGELMKSQASTARSTMVGVVDEARTRVADHAADARERVTTATADLEAVIERNPLIAVVAALIAGLFMGVLSRPRR